MLNAADLGDFRDAQSEGYPDTFSRVSKAGSSDGMGGLLAGTTTTTANLKGRFYQLNGEESEVGGGIHEMADIRLHCAHDLTLGIKDQVLWAGTTYEVVRIDEPRDWKTAQMIYLRRVK